MWARAALLQVTDVAFAFVVRVAAEPSDRSDFRVAFVSCAGFLTALVRFEFFVSLLVIAETLRDFSFVILPFRRISNKFWVRINVQFCAQSYKTPGKSASDDIYLLESGTPNGSLLRKARFSSAHWDGFPKDCKCVSRIGSLRVEQIFMPGIQEGNRRLARRPPTGESSNVIVPS
jgi:hypothetical protein